MTNQISVVWSSDQRQLIADMQKRQVMQDKEIARLKLIGDTGKATGTTLTSSYRESTKEIERLGRVAETAFKRPVSAMDQHLNRMKELRALFRMGKLDAEQFDRAASASLKQKYADTGARARLAEKKKELIEATALSARQQAEELNRTQAFYAARRKFWEADTAAQEAARQKATAKSLKDQADERTAQSKFYSERRKFWEADAAAQKEQQKSLGDQVRRGLMSEREIARQNYRERMRHLWDLRKQGSISSQEYVAAAKQAHDAWKQVASIDIGAAWRGMPGLITSSLTATAAVAASMRLIREEFDNIKSRQKDAANATMTYAEAQSEAVQNLDGSMTPADLDKEVMSIAKKKGISPAFVMRAASNVLGARGAVSAKEAMGAIGTSIDFNPYNQGAANFTASAILAQKAVDPKASFNAILGQQKSAKIASPVVTDQDFAHYVVPMATSSGSFGDSRQAAYGLAGYLGTRMSDSTGRVTATAGVDLMRDLMTHPGLKDVQTVEGDATYSRIKAIADDKKYRNVQATLLGEINAKTQDELVKSGGKLTTEAKSYGAIADLLSGKKEMWDLFEQKRREVLPLDKSAEDLVEQQRSGLAGLPAQQTARAELGLKSIVETMQLENQGAARGSVSREGLQGLLKSSGVANVEQYIQGMRFELGSGGGQEAPADQAAKLLRERAEKVTEGQRAPVSQSVRFSPTGYDFSQRPMIGPTAEQREIADSLNRAAAALEALAKQPPPTVQVNVPGDNKPAPVPAAGRQGGRF